MAHLSIQLYLKLWRMILSFLIDSYTHIDRPTLWMRRSGTDVRLPSKISWKGLASVGFGLGIFASQSLHQILFGWMPSVNKITKRGIHEGGLSIWVYLEQILQAFSVVGIRFEIFPRERLYYMGKGPPLQGYTNFGDETIQSLTNVGYTVGVNDMLDISSRIWRAGKRKFISLTCGMIACHEI